MADLPSWISHYQTYVAPTVSHPSSSSASSSSNSSGSGNSGNIAYMPQAPVAYNPAADIERLKEMQKAQRLGQLQKSRDTALSNLNTEKATIAPQYYQKRNETATGSQLQAKNFAEYMANRGLTSSGTNAQAEISRNATLQGNIGALNRQEQAANDDIARRQSDINNAYESDVASANAGIEANAVNQLISAQQQAYAQALNQYNADRAFGYQIGRDSIVDNRYNQQYADSRSDINYNRNYQTSRDSVADTRYDQQYSDSRSDVNYNREYQRSQDEINNKLRQAQFDFQREQVQIDNSYRRDSFEWQKAMQEAEQSFKEKQAAIQQSQWQQGFNSDTYWKQKQFDYNSTQDTQNYNLKLTELESAKNKNTTTDALKQIDYVTSTIDSIYLTKDVSGKVVVNNPEQVRAYIFSLGLGPDLTKQLLLRYGLPVTTANTNKNTGGGIGNATDNLN